MQTDEGTVVGLYGAVPDEVFDVVSTLQDSVHFRQDAMVNGVNWLIYQTEVRGYGLSFIALRMVSLEDSSMLIGGFNKSLHGLLEELKGQVN